MKYRYIWFKQELLDILNKLGYVHFFTKDAVDSFEYGKAFYYCEEEKTYGYVPCIPNSEIDNIKENEKYLQDAILKDKR